MIKEKVVSFFKKHKIAIAGVASGALAGVVYLVGYKRGRDVGEDVGFKNGKVYGTNCERNIFYGCYIQDKEKFENTMDKYIAMFPEKTRAAYNKIDFSDGFTDRGMDFREVEHL